MAKLLSCIPKSTEKQLLLKDQGDKMAIARPEVQFKNIGDRNPMQASFIGLRKHDRSFRIRDLGDHDLDDPVLGFMRLEVGKL